MNFNKGLSSVQGTVMIAAFVILAAVLLIAIDSLGQRTRDTQRVSTISSLQNLLSLYASNNGGNYPSTLSALVPSYIPVLPVEPLSHSSLGYSYAALGSGSNCTSYHLGVALENTSNAVLNTDNDALPAPVCDGSAPDFNGLSSAPAGQPCSPAVPAASGAESCYDVTP